MTPTPPPRNFVVVARLALSLAFYGPLLQAQRSHLTAGDAEIADETQARDWLAYGRTHSERRFSPLQQIHDGNVAQLKPDWYVDLPNDVGLVSTPLVIDGVIYFVGTMNVVRALDAATGKLIWEFDPEVAKAIAGRRQVGHAHNRGLSFSRGRIFATTWDGRLIALDAKTGRLLWSTRTFPTTEALYITGAPKAFKDKVLVGNGGTEAGPTRGFVKAFDAATGALAWKFFIVPGNPADGFENEAMAMAAKTWTGEWWKHGGGGNAWHGFTYDAEFDTLYIGTGNGAPYNRKVRSPGGGDNLFLCSIVALNPDTGAYKWHYQTTPGEVWDYTSNMDIVLADLPLGGRTLKAILHAPKNGFFYVLDRATGKLVSAEPFAKVTWASRVDLATGRPVENPEARYPDGRAEFWPGTTGAHSWQAMSYSPVTGLTYLPVIHAGSIFDDTQIDLKTWRAKPFQGRSIGVVATYAPKPPGHISGSLDAWDPIAQKRIWSVPLPGEWNGGTLVTAGNVVFQGRTDGRFAAHDARTGRDLWSIELGLGIPAPPITYQVGDIQYIALLVGWGGNGSGLRGSEHGWMYGAQTRRLVAFSLRGAARLPPQPPPMFPVPLQPADFVVDPARAAEGARLYSIYCGTCHGPGAKAGGMAPDLRASPVLLDLGALAQVVRDGARLTRAMPQFPDITDDELRALTHYIRKIAAEAAPAPIPRQR
jgi:quinohemoprotein ethanol dehydrogenase